MKQKSIKRAYIKDLNLCALYSALCTPHLLKILTSLRVQARETTAIITNNTETIAEVIRMGVMTMAFVAVGNHHGVHQDLKQPVLTIPLSEQLFGYHLFQNLPKSKKKRLRKLDIRPFRWKRR